MSELVVVVNEQDVAVGTAEKLMAHRAGVLHRALSVFLLDGDGRILLQRRAASKYHSGGLWSNACCSHPRPGEPVAEAARRRLAEELGVRCELRPVGSFVYRAEVGDDLVEHELDHLFLGDWAGTPDPDPDEVSECRWVTRSDLEAELAADPDRFTPWLRLALRELDRLGVLSP